MEAVGEAVGGGGVGRVGVRSSLRHHKGQRFDICCSSLNLSFHNGAAGKRRGPWGNDARQHTRMDAQICVHMHTLSVPCSRAHASSTDQTTRRGWCHKERYHYTDRDAWRLASKTPAFLVFFSAFFLGWLGGAELNGISSPRGTAKVEQCWNKKWFMLLSSQVNSAALSAITLTFWQAEGQITKATLSFSHLFWFAFPLTDNKDDPGLHTSWVFVATAY